MIFITFMTFMTFMIFMTFMTFTAGLDGSPAASTAWPPDQRPTRQ
jgi:hypothetical protein